MYKHPVISILVPIFKVEKYIERCARSIFEQTYQNIEIIFVDDCSPDKSISILEEVIENYPEHKKNTRIITHEKNKGLSAARNTALLNASGEYVMHIDSDDWVDKRIVEKLYNAIIKDNSDIAVCGINFVYDNYTRVMIDKIPTDKIEYLDQLFLRRLSFNLVAKLFRRNMICENEILSVHGISHGEDMIVYPRIVYSSKSFVSINEALYFYDQKNTNSLMNNFSEKGIEDIIFVTTFLKNFIEKNITKSLSKRLVNDLVLSNTTFLLHISPLKSYNKITNYYNSIKISYNSSWPLKFKLLYCILFVDISWLTYISIRIRSWLIR